MIEVNHTGTNVSIEEQQVAKQRFIDQLENFRDEFDEKGGVAIIHHDEPLDSPNRITFNLKNGELSDFVSRFNDFKKTKYSL